jgi:hypothetical protein
VDKLKELVSGTLNECQALEEIILSAEGPLFILEMLGPRESWIPCG